MNDYMLLGGLLVLGIAALVYFDYKLISSQPCQDPSETGKKAEKGDSEALDDEIYFWFYSPIKGEMFYQKLGDRSYCLFDEFGENKILYMKPKELEYIGCSLDLE